MSPSPPPSLESLLASPPHVDDAGFTDRVMARLPRRRRAPRVVYALVPAATAVGAAIAVLLCGASLASAPMLVMLATLVVTSSLATTAA